ncbi:PucR family transcriptional regulator [Actinomadura madurae]|uniref:PucR family transcriptional regulator n=1 Tax=Actinomadura madurae TaxID=1993 RepID=UPI0026E52B8E|nr:helix-turn-helix domain-containing protein [Actinomadura madurae]
MRHPPVSAAARRLAARLEPRVNELARRMARESFEQVPGYAALPDDMKDVEIAATARFGMRQFLRGIRDGHVRAGTGGDMLFLERAAQRADEGLPLHLLVRSHALGTYVLWQALREAARPGEEEALAELVDQLLSVGPAVLGSIVRTYLDERHAVHAEEHAQRRALAGSLLDGRLPADEPQLVRMGLDGPALVLALDPPPAGDAGTVATRRLQRRIQSALDQAFAASTVVLLDAAGGRALIPGAAKIPEDLAGRLAQAAGHELRSAAVPAPGPAAVAEAARTSAEVLRIARACGHPPAVHRLDDVLLEYHLSRPGESADRIAALLDPLDDHPHLLETLRTHLGSRQQRRATATALGVHPNTVDNRIAKATELTGLDLTTPHGTALALAALLLKQA